MEGRTAEHGQGAGEPRVVTTTSGQPLRLDLGGRRYRVAADPVQWFERRNWWEEVDRAPKGQCPHLVDREMWQVQVTPESTGRRRPLRDEDYLTLELERNRDTGAWILVAGPGGK